LHHANREKATKEIQSRKRELERENANCFRNDKASCVLFFYEETMLTQRKMRAHSFNNASSASWKHDHMIPRVLLHANREKYAMGFQKRKQKR